MRRASSIVLALLLTACATTGPYERQEPVLVDRLFCGLEIPGGGTVSEAELKQFLDEVVVPKFPDGFTVYRAEGVFQREHEPSVIIEIIHDPDERITRDVEEIAQEYRRRFRQTAVLRVTIPAGMATID
jgi:hypothetical protein